MDQLVDMCPEEIWVCIHQLQVSATFVNRLSQMRIRMLKKKKKCLGCWHLSVSGKQVLFLCMSLKENVLCWQNKKHPILKIFLWVVCQTGIQNKLYRLRLIVVRFFHSSQNFFMRLWLFKAYVIRANFLLHGGCHYSFHVWLKLLVSCRTSGTVQSNSSHSSQ